MEDRQTDMPPWGCHSPPVIHQSPSGSLPAFPSSVWFLSPSVSYTHDQTPGFQTRMLWAVGTLMWGLLLPGAQSESAQSKMRSGIGGFVLGLIFLGVGLFVHFWDKRGKAPWEKKGKTGAGLKSLC